MSELLIELFSEEMPPKLQVNARNELKKLFTDELSTLNLKYKGLNLYSTPTRLTILISDLPTKIKILSSEIKGPKIHVTQNIVENFELYSNLTNIILRHLKYGDVRHAL